MEKIKIIEGDAMEFESQVDKIMKQGYKVIIETHRMIEYVGKPYYSCLFVKEVKE